MEQTWIFRTFECRICVFIESLALVSAVKRNFIVYKWQRLIVHFFYRLVNTFFTHNIISLRCVVNMPAKAIARTAEKKKRETLPFKHLYKYNIRWFGKRLFFFSGAKAKTNAKKMICQWQQKKTISFFYGLFSIINVKYIYRYPKNGMSRAENQPISTLFMVSKATPMPSIVIFARSRQAMAIGEWVFFISDRSLPAVCDTSVL